MDRSYMSNRYGYYSPKHDGMVDDVIHGYQVKSGSYKSLQHDITVDAHLLFTVIWKTLKPCEIHYGAFFWHWVVNFKVLTGFHIQSLTTCVIQVSSLGKEKDPFRLNWEMENLDNIALSSSVGQSGYVK